MILTRISKKFECDKFIQRFPENFKAIHVSKTWSQDKIPYDVVIYGNMNVLKENPELIPKRIISLLPKHEEMQYLELIHKIMTTGKVKDD